MPNWPPCLTKCCETNRRSTMRNHLVRILHTVALVWLAWLSGIAWAAPSSSYLVLGDKLQQPTHGFLKLFRDPSQRLTLPEILADQAQQFQPVQDNLSLGFTSDAVWLSLSVVKATADSPNRWWLEVGQPLFLDVRLFERTETGAVIEIQGRSEVAIRQHMLDDRKPVFEIELLDTRPRSYYLRIVSQTAISSDFTLWQPNEFVKANALYRFMWGTVYGAYSLVLVFYILFWLWTRERIHLLYIAYVATNCLASLFSGGWPRQFFPSMSDSSFVLMLGLWISLSLPIGASFSLYFLHLDKIWKTFTRGTIVCVVIIFVACITLLFSGYYTRAMIATQSTGFALALMLMAFAIYRSYQGDSSARFFLFAFSFFYLGVMLRFAKNFGLIEHSPLTDNSYQVGAFIHMLVMSIGIFSEYNKIRREKQVTEQKLDTELRLREQQTEFMSMISHEFRTPLTIISASSTNLLNDSSLSEKAIERVKKILRANQRITTMMEDYLTHERLLADSTRLALKSIDVVTLVNRVALEFKDTDGPLLRTPPIQHMVIEGDADLLHIAICNLVTNAKRYSPANSGILLTAYAHENTVDIVVQDQGPGIAEEDLPHIFKKFYRGKEASGKAGSGLGLHLVQSIVQRHAGEIVVRPMEAGGTEFIIRLPRKHPAVH